jgi:O-antigen/teichoic acid export membrane protein
LGAIVKRKSGQHSTTIFALAIRGGAVLAGFVVTYVLGHNLGPAATGQFALISQTAFFLAVAGLMGLDVGVVRHFAKAVTDTCDIEPMTMLKVMGSAIGLLLIIAVILWLGGDIVWRSVFGDQIPRNLLLVLCVMLIGRGGAQLFGGMLRSQHRFNLGQAIAALTVPAATAIALVCGWVNDVHGALWVGAFAAIASSLIGALAMIRHLSRTPNALRIDMRVIMQSSIPLWGAGLALTIGDWYGLYIAAQMLSLADAGLYRVAIQIAASLQIISATIFAIYAAKISTAFHADDRHQVALLARSALRVSTALAIPVGLILILAGPLLLKIIGPDFQDAFPVMVVLIIGQVLYALLGPPGLVLAMAGHEKINLMITLIGISALLISAPLAAEFGGLTGIAVAISSVMLLRNLAAYIILRKKLGISIWQGRFRPSS